VAEDHRLGLSKKYKPGTAFFLDKKEIYIPVDSMRRVQTPPLWGDIKGMYPETDTLPKQPYPVRSAAGLVDCLSALLPWNINLFVLRETESRLLVLLYEKNLLAKTLSGGGVRCFLADSGYPAAFSMPLALHYLKKRFTAGDFPHEVGLFLGYPVEDVTGFIRHKGQHYKLHGYWKVYGDVEGAKRLFRQYDLCREYMERILT
jgi:hypothetical protein